MSPCLGRGERVRGLWALDKPGCPGADVPVPSQVTMESPHREAEPGQQEQELRQILNKDKSKRSKSLACPLSAASPPEEPRPQTQGARLAEGWTSGCQKVVLPLSRPSSAFSWSKGVWRCPHR